MRILPGSKGTSRGSCLREPPPEEMLAMVMAMLSSEGYNNDLWRILWISRYRTRRSSFALLAQRVGGLF